VPQFDYTENYEFWRDKVLGYFEGMLSTGDYLPTQHSKHLEFFSKWIIPLLGPKPRSKNGNCFPSYQSYMCDDYTPIELSMAWKSEGRNPLMRFSIEPLPQHNPDEQGDPPQLVAYGLRVLDIFCRSFQAPAPWSAFPNYLIVEPSLFTDVLKSIGFTDARHATSIVSNIFLAFDLLPCHVQLKSYCVLNSTLGRGEKLTLVTKAISTHAPETAVSAMSAYFQSKPPDWHTKSSPDPFIIGVDCTGTRDARIKIYIRFQVTDFHDIVDHLSLGGRIPVSSACIDTVHDLWGRFGGHPFLCSSHTSGVLFYYDFSGTKSLPNVKVYIPVRLMARSDQEIVDKTAEWMSHHAHFSNYRQHFLKTVSNTRYACSFYDRIYP
jgi:DMATS type aromatic prenyltransferase